MDFHWNPRAEREIRDEALRKEIEKDLEAAFSEPRAKSVTIGDVFSGYRSDKATKAILGVQVRYEAAFAMHIVKVGLASEVAGDAEQYRLCMVAEKMASRLLMRVTGHHRAPDRYAVVYEDAYQLFGAKDADDKPETLEQIVFWAIKRGDLDVTSVERVITQIYRELNRCFYHDAQPNSALAREFYQEKLKWGEDTGPWATWTKRKEYRDLRRNAIWLTSANWKPEDEGMPGYLDPVEYLEWIFKSGEIPSTLAGRSHGDLHGRNILAGLCRGEAEQPVVFDYGDMGPRNAVIWDFVKLEVELKCLLLHEFRTDPKAKAALDAKLPPLRQAVQNARQRMDHGIVAGQADRMEFAYQFERLLAYFTKEILDPVTAQASGAAAENLFTEHEPLNRAIRIFLRVRQEAAIWLGYNRGRGGEWAAEYYLGLMVYGLQTVKWGWVATRQEWALISAGVAAAQLGERGELLTKPVSLPRETMPPVAPPSYVVVRKWARHYWNAGQAVVGASLLGDAIGLFPEAVPLRTEYALCLSACGRYREASEQLASLSHLCEIFRDFEFLSRFGNSLKNEGDQAWKRDPDEPSLKEIIASWHPAANYYLQAFDQYHKAYEFSEAYFPGINAATLALLHGEEARSRELAATVAHTCRNWRYTNATDQFWVFATKGEAALLLQSPREALSHYQAALSVPGMQWAGFVNPLYEQLCRLYWALGAEPVEPIIQMLENGGFLRGLGPGPFGNCGR